MFGIRLHFLGKAQEAIDFYSEIFHTHPHELITYGDYKANGEGTEEIILDEESSKFIMHAEMKIYGGRVLFCDIPYSLSDQFQIGNNAQIIIEYDNEEKANDQFDHLANNDGQVLVPFNCHEFRNFSGHVIDKYGNFWIFLRGKDLQEAEETETTSEDNKEE